MDRNNTIEFEEDNPSINREEIEQALSDFASANGLTDLFYCYDICANTEINQNDDPDKLCNRFKKRARIFFSSENGRDYFKTVIIGYVLKDRHLRAKFEKKLFQRNYVRECVCAYDKLAGGASKTEELHENFGYQKKFELVMPCPRNSHFFARFIIMTSNHDMDEAGVLRELKPKLVELHKDFANQYISSINPVIDYQYIKANSLRVLESLAKGLSRKEAAEKLYLTVRGIDYHIELMKTALAAPNIPNAIYKACALSLIR
ncbi:helix-turn-helix transcriptional regulator [Ferrimonas lipolytica]|uniref:Regulatory protein, luxR family n=1 Tax=Ferrimonas lipolytica TaxID=2724191 RepID=A0A6H1UE04_9GAMM|nr:hypothetical protein [Ferrimonas lipolytica]QIZ77274.1 hypothetical protein HER31_10515 [Ferrimonas lipolytica]